MTTEIEDMSLEQLDCAVAQAEGMEYAIVDGACWIGPEGARELYRPSTDWLNGGPVIERHNVPTIESDDGAAVLAEAMREFVRRVRVAGGGDA